MRGRPRLYGDVLIQVLAGHQELVPIAATRHLQGFAQSMRDLALAALPVPNCTTLCRRAQTLEAQLARGPTADRVQRRTTPSGDRQHRREGLR